ncbi:MAG: hypothetical protein LUD03_06555 [Firmicutes bacterium]|nr:hypothetical protein [Bacillota bacterium]
MAVVNKKYYVAYCNYTNAPFIIEDDMAQVYTNKHAVFTPPAVPNQKSEWRLTELSSYDAMQRLMSIFGFKRFMLNNDVTETAPLPYTQKVQLNNVAPELWLKRIKSIQIADEELYDDALCELKESELLLAVRDDGEPSDEDIQNEGYPTFLAMKNEKFEFVPVFTNMIEFLNFKNTFTGGKALKVSKYRYQRLPENIRKRNLWINPSAQNSWLILDEDRKILEK